jgi:hypothetical protein
LFNFGLDHNLLPGTANIEVVCNGLCKSWHNTCNWDEERDIGSPVPATVIVVDTTALVKLVNIELGPFDNPKVADNNTSKRTPKMCE